MKTLNFFLTASIALLILSVSCQKDNNAISDTNTDSNSSTPMQTLKEFLNIRGNQRQQLAVDMYLKLTGIRGEATGEEHEGWIDLFAVSMNERLMIAGQAVQPTYYGHLTKFIEFNKLSDSSSPALKNAYKTESLIPSATLSIVKTTQEKNEFMMVELRNVKITSYQISGSESDDIVIESIALNFEEIKTTKS